MYNQWTTRGFEHSRLVSYGLECRQGEVCPDSTNGNINHYVSLQFCTACSHNTTPTCTKHSHKYKHMELIMLTVNTAHIVHEAE